MLIQGTTVPGKDWEPAVGVRSIDCSGSIASGNVGFNAFVRLSAVTSVYEGLRFKPYTLNRVQDFWVEGLGLAAK